MGSSAPTVVGLGRSAAGLRDGRVGAEGLARELGQLGGSSDERVEDGVRQVELHPRLVLLGDQLLVVDDILYNVTEESCDWAS